MVHDEITGEGVAPRGCLFIYAGLRKVPIRRRVEGAPIAQY